MYLLKTLEKMPYAVLVLMVASISIVNLRNDFIFIDDINLIVNNPHLNFSLINLVNLFAKPLGQTSADSSMHFFYYRPTLNLFYMINATIWGINPVGFHVSNLMLHLFTTFLTYHIGLLLFADNKGVSLLAAALFAIHPVHNELVGRVAMNENLLGFFIALALYSYFQKRKYLSLTAFALALLTKESAVMLFFVIFIFELRYLKLWPAILSMLPHVFLVAAYLLLRTIVVGFPHEAAFNPNFVETLIITSAALTSYLRLLLIPYPLDLYSPVFKLVSPLQPELLLAIVVCPLLAYLIWKWRTDILLRSLVLGILVLLMPVILKANALVLGLDNAFIAERQLYVPTILYSLLIASLLNKYVTLSVGKYAVISLLFVLPVFICLSINCASVWKNNDTVLAAFLEKHPESSIAHSRRGTILMQKGNYDEALTEFRAVLPVRKADTIAGFRFGQINLKKKEIVDTDSLMENCGLSAYQVQYAETFYNIGQVYCYKKDFDTAIKKFRTALVLDPSLTEARIALADIYQKKRMFNDASREYSLLLKSTKI